MDKLLIKRGSKRALEQLDPLPVGELFLAKDEERLYVGGPKGNIPIATQKEVDEKYQEVATQLEQTEQQLYKIIPVDVEKHGADRTGKKDSTQAFRKAFKEAYDLSLNHSGWRSPKILKIPSGEYLITDTIIDDSLEVQGARFVIQGDGWQSTKIQFNPTEPKYLFDNNGVFGFTTFIGIEFNSNYVGKFMNAVGGGSGNAQSLIFEKCRFGRFNNLIKVTGKTMMSEVTFTDCKIAQFDEDSVIFSFDNPQAVNWRFFGTDIESFSGVLFEYLSGMTVSIYQGSIITTDGTIVRVPSNANSNEFGQGNAPNLQIDGSRFEMRGYAKLIEVLNSNVVFTMSLRNVGMGGFNLTSDLEHYPIDIRGRGLFYFDTCTNWNNYRIKAHVMADRDFINPARFEFRNSGPSSKTLLSQSKFTWSGPDINRSASSPILVFKNYDIDGVVRLEGFSRYGSSDFTFPASYHSKSYDANGRGVVSFYTGEGKVTVFKEDMSGIILYDMKVNLSNNPGFGNTAYSVKIYRESDGMVLYEGNHDTSKSWWLDIDKTKLPLTFDLGDNLVFEFRPITTRTDNALCILNGAILLLY